MEVFKFPKKSYYLTQGFGVNTFSHKNRKAIDVSARGGYKEIYAPFSGYVSKIYVKRNNSYTIWLTSNEKVLCADGVARFAVVMILDYYIDEDHLIKMIIYLMMVPQEM